MTDREVEPHSSNGQKELPTILRFHVKHQLLGNDEEAYSASPNMEAYSATGKIHLRQQEENQKENAI